MRKPDLSPLLFLTPLASTLLAAHQVTSSRVSFCAATALVEVVDVVDRRLHTIEPTRVPAPLRGLRTRLFIPMLALGSSLLLLAGASFSPPNVAAGLHTAGFVGIALSVVLALVRSFARGQGNAGTSQTRTTQLLVADVAKPVTCLAPVSWDAPADLRLLSRLSYGAVQHPSCPRLVCYRDVRSLPADRLAVVVWWEVGLTVPLVDGARPVPELDRRPHDEEVWLVTAGDLVIGVLTSDAVKLAARASSAQRRPDQSVDDVRDAGQRSPGA